jgi:arylsulfatase
MSKRPNILLILNDDMGYSDLGCYGGEVRTPTLDRLAGNGLRFTQFYNTARCCPSRASLLTGLHPHQADVGHMMGDDGVDGYLGDLSRKAVTIPEVLRTAGYRTYMSGKWHVTHYLDGPKHNWPRQRGFDRFYGLINGAADYFNPGTLARDNSYIPAEPGHYLTDAISDEMAGFIDEHFRDTPKTPFFGYLAYTAPHWPLHAMPEDLARYKGRFDAGWDTLREERLARMREMGVLSPDWELTERDPAVPPWDEAENKEWQAARMEAYAAQIDRMDQGIGRVVEALQRNGALDNTLIVFLADNGGCAEEIGEQWRGNMLRMRIGSETTWDGQPVEYGNRPEFMPGGQGTYQSCGVPWANVQNTPFRLYKHWVHEGGISTPFIVHWPAGIEAKGEFRTQPAQLPDVMATFLDVADAPYPETYAGEEIQPLEGFTMAPLFRGEPYGREVLVWEHEGNKAIRRGKWKLVRRYPGEWELFDMDADRSEMHDFSAEHPGLVAELAGLWSEWADRCGVVPWEDLLALRKAKREAR